MSKMISQDDVILAPGETKPINLAGTLILQPKNGRVQVSNESTVKEYYTIGYQDSLEVVVQSVIYVKNPCQNTTLRVALILKDL